MKNLSPEEAIAILSDMKIDIPIPKAAVTQIKRNIALDMAISALRCSEIPNSSDTISRQEVTDTVRKIILGFFSDEDGVMTDTEKTLMRVNKAICNGVRELPPAQPERMRGKWIERNPQNSDKCRLIECDQCGFSHIVGFNVPYEHWIENRNFCERCGADMRGEQDENR